MKILKGNLFTDPPINKILPESFESIVRKKELLIERIVTNPGFQTPGEWYDQEKDEWVLLAEGSAELELEKGETILLRKGDYLLIPSHTKHRIRSVSNNPGCIWLGIHADMK